MSDTSSLRRSTRVSRLPTGRSLVAHPVAEAPFVPSVPPPASMDADATPTTIDPTPSPISIPSGDVPSRQVPTAIPSVPSGSPESSLLVRLDEDVSALRMEIGVSRAREENLVALFYIVLESRLENMTAP
jgi:hypothetical protein